MLTGFRSFRAFAVTQYTSRCVKLLGVVIFFMSYMAANILIVNILIIPMLTILWWQVGWKNWLIVLLVILSYPLLDVDHFILTNLPGFGAQAMPNQKILHVFHTVEFLILVAALTAVSYFTTSKMSGLTFKAWLLPITSNSARNSRSYLAWSGRILLLGAVIHWLIDLVIYTVHHKWDYLYLSVIEYLLNPT